MNIIVIGAGGVGGFFGGKLAQAGFNVTFIVRGKHLEAIAKNGLKVKSIQGDFTVHPKVTDQIQDVSETPDLIILGVKSWQVTEVAEQIKPLLHKNLAILPLQNGADNADKLQRVLGKENVLCGLCQIISKVEGPGVINHFGFEPKIVFGELNNRKTERVLKIQSAFEKAGINSKISDDILTDVWRKFMFITTISALGGLTRSPIGAIREAPYLRQIMLDTANEVLKIAKAKHIALTKDDIEKAFKNIDSLDYHSTASLQRDIMDGKPSELDNFNGYIVRQGKELGIETPVNALIYHCLMPMEKKARKLL